jgi:hypothetical protein
MKKLALIFFVFIALSVSGIKIQENSINVIVNSQGESLIEETYFVSFADENEFSLFKEKIKEEISAETLKEFGLNIEPRLEEKAVFSFSEQGENKTIRLNYASDSLFIIKKRITFDEFKLNQQKFSFLKSSGKIVFPENFSLRFVLPREAKINEVVPATKIFSKTVEWTGPLISDKVSIAYSIEKKPEPVKIKKTVIKIKVKEDGFGFISEKYFFEFKDEEELNYFKEITRKNGSSLLSWIAFDERIFPHIGENELDTKNASVEFIEKGLNDSYLSIVYENEKPVFIEKPGTGRFVEWVFNSKKLNKLISAGVIVLPENTVLEIELPSNAQIKENNLEEKNGKIFWEGYKTTSKINLSYLVQESIAPTFNLSATIQRIISDRNSALSLMATLIIASLIIYFKRETITEKIDSFVIKHSKIEKSEEAEIEIEE